MKLTQLEEEGSQKVSSTYKINERCFRGWIIPRIDVLSIMYTLQYNVKGIFISEKSSFYQTLNTGQMIKNLTFCTRHLFYWALLCTILTS